MGMTVLKPRASAACSGPGFVVHVFLSWVCCSCPVCGVISQCRAPQCWRSTSCSALTSRFLDSERSHRCHWSCSSSSRRRLASSAGPWAQGVCSPVVSSPATHCFCVEWLLCCPWNYCWSEAHRHPDRTPCLLN